jgi:hypothetical protein
MDQFSFHGPFAYRWIDDVPVDRIDLRSGERRPIEVGTGGIPPVIPPGQGTIAGLALSDDMEDEGAEKSASEAVVRAAMAAWN